jgi:hypothetical protein
VCDFDESRAWRITKAEAVNRLAGDGILSTGSFSYAWIEILLRRIVSDKNSTNRFDAACVFGVVCCGLRRG